MTLERRYGGARAPIVVGARVRAGRGEDEAVGHVTAIQDRRILIVSVDGRHLIYRRSEVTLAPEIDAGVHVLCAIADVEVPGTVLAVADGYALVRVDSYAKPQRIPLHRVRVG